MSAAAIASRVSAVSADAPGAARAAGAASRPTMSTVRARQAQRAAALSTHPHLSALRASYQIAWERHRPALVRYARRYLRNTQQAEDAADAGLLRAWENWGTYHERPAPAQRSCLYLAVYSACMDALRRRALVAGAPLRLDGPQSAASAASAARDGRTLCDELADTLAAPIDVARDAEDDDTVRHLLASCTPRQRLIVQLRCQGYTLPEIVALLGTTRYYGPTGVELANTVGSLKHDLEMLRAALLTQGIGRDRA